MRTSDIEDWAAAMVVVEREKAAVAQAQRKLDDAAEYAKTCALVCYELRKNLAQRPHAWTTKSGVVTWEPGADLRFYPIN